MSAIKETPSQTAGPYVHIGCMPTFAGLEGMYGGKDLGNTMITATHWRTDYTMSASLRCRRRTNDRRDDRALQPGPDGYLV